jgi:hypothetical protein
MMKTLLYIDPGFGSMVIQVIIGAIAAGSAALYMFRQKVAKFFDRFKNKDEQGV